MAQFQSKVKVRLLRLSILMKLLICIQMYVVVTYWTDTSPTISTSPAQIMRSWLKRKDIVSCSAFS